MNIKMPKVFSEMKGDWFGVEKQLVVLAGVIGVVALGSMAFGMKYEKAKLDRLGLYCPKEARSLDPIPDGIFVGTVTEVTLSKVVLTVSDGTTKEFSITEKTRAGRTLGALSRLAVGRYVEIAAGKNADGSLEAQVIRVPKDAPVTAPVSETGDTLSEKNQSGEEK